MCVDMVVDTHCPLCVAVFVLVFADLSPGLRVQALSQVRAPSLKRLGEEGGQLTSPCCCFAPGVPVNLNADAGHVSGRGKVLPGGSPPHPLRFSRAAARCRTTATSQLPSRL